jgi:hypothetical protein
MNITEAECDEVIYIYLAKCWYGISVEQVNNRCNLMKGKLFTRNVTSRCVRVTTVAVGGKYHIFVCVCVLACVGARERGPLHARVVLLNKHAACMRHTVTSFMAPLAPPHFSTLSHKRHDFRETLLNIKCVF